MRVAVLAFACLLPGVAGVTANASEATLQRMQYWSSAETVMPAGDRYLIFDFDAGGLNNIRIGWEFSGVIAKLTGRTLVMPPPTQMYLLDSGPRNMKYLARDLATRKTVTSMEDLLNMRQLHGNLPVISAEQFEQRTGLAWSLAKKQADMIKTNGPNKFHIDPKTRDCNNVPEYQAIKNKFLYMPTPDGRREGFSCGEWWVRGGPKWGLKHKMGDGEWALLQHGFVWHEDAFDIAAKAVNYLGLFEYVAMHARYNDFAEKQAQQGPKQLFENWRDYIPAGSVLYVASDDPDKVKGQAPPGVRLVMWDDFFNNGTGQLLEETRRKYTPERWFKLIGLVEELICTYSKIFVGTDRSSFTGHIQRMRIHAGAPTTERINHKDGITRKVLGPKDFPQVRREIDLWQRTGQKHHFRPSDKKHGTVFLQTT